jgi:hypothetical protein
VGKRALDLIGWDHWWMRSLLRRSRLGVQWDE